MNMWRKEFLAWGGGCIAVGLTITVFGRDPFFPLGYEIKNVSKSDGEVQPKMTVVHEERKKITSDDWAAARKVLQVNGFASSGDKQVVLVNGKSYRAGDKIMITNQGVIFTWRVELPAELKLNLVPLEAERL